VKIVGKDILVADFAYGGVSFNDLLKSSPNGVFRRVCISCDERAQNIYGKRHNLENMQVNHLMTMINGWEKKTGYEHGKDFDLYATYEDAKTATNKFVCNFNYRNRFPGQCGPDGKLYNQYGPIYDPWGKPDMAYYVEKGELDLNIVSTTTIDSIDFKVDVFNNRFPVTVRSDGEGTYYITSSGWDLWWSRNEYTYFHSSEPVEGDLDISVKIDEHEAKSYWTKTGILLRETLEPYAKSYFPFLNRDKKANVQYKTSSTGYSWRHTQRNDKPSHLRLTRVGNVFTTYWKTESDDEWNEWNKVTIEMNAAVYVGLAQVANNYWRLCEAKFSEFSVKKINSGVEAAE